MKGGHLPGFPEVVPMTLTVFFRMAAMTLLMTGSIPASAQENTPGMTVDGMQLISDDNNLLVYALPGINFDEYERIYLDEAYVAFKKHWQDQQTDQAANRLNVDDMARIKIELRSLFREVFSRALEESGYQLTTEPADDVLQIKPAIINLDIVKAEEQPASRTYSFSESGGEITLYLELYDSSSGDIIARVIDGTRDRQTGYFRWQNHISNRAAAGRILQVWANKLKDGLDGARTATPGTDEIQTR